MNSVLLTCMAACLVALGSNLGDRGALLQRAVDLLRGNPHIKNLSVSTWHETSPIGGPAGQAAFLNGAVRFDTALEPAALLALLHDVEAQLGRRRNIRWQARTLDLDLLLYGDQVIQTPALTVPHPRMAVRRFVLAPAAEIAGEMIHPQIGWSVARLLAHLESAYPYVALTGAAGAGKTELARLLRDARGMQWIADPEDSASRSETELAALRRNALRNIDVGHTAGAVSDFWIPQSLAFARPTLSPTEFADLEKRVEAALRDTLAPKLLVLLDSKRADPVAAELRRLVTRPDQGPFLALDAARPRIARAELLAAVEAMG